mgnify:CR=1 FL=1
MKNVREEIIKNLKSELQANPHVFALWLEGADSNDTVDQYSDIDIWIDVKDGHEQKVMNQVRHILSKIGPLDLAQDYNHPDPKIKQSFFHIKGSSVFLLLDICIQSHSRTFKFIKEITHELPFVLFDKKNVTKLYPIDKRKTDREIKRRLQDLDYTIRQASRAKKYILRGKFLEALIYYHKWIMAPLVEILRIKYRPLTRDYHLTHISDHLPIKEVKKLEELYKVYNLKDIDQKTRKAIQWFRKVESELRSMSEPDVELMEFYDPSINAKAVRLVKLLK